VVRAHPGFLAVAVSPEHVGADREELEILGVQVSLAPGRRELGKGRAPPATRN
jgi:hypothetical protein